MSQRIPRPLAVLFDLDGTLIDSIELILSSARYAFQGRDGHIPDDAEWLTGVGIPLVAMFRRYTDDPTEVDALIAKYREYQLEHHDRLVRCYDAVLETVDFIRAAGHPVGIVTSKAVWLARRGLDHVGLGPHFDLIVGCDSCERHKPDPEPVLLALERLGCHPSDAVFVGDSVHDIHAGNAAGVTTVAALWGPFGREDLVASRPTFFLERISDLPRLLSDVQAIRNKGSRSA
jgi:pyrophosphatase PpaX